MQTFSFTLLTLASFWRPLSWESKFSHNAYTCYRVVVLIIYYTFMVSEILDIILWAENIEEVVENMIQLINITNVMFKSTSFMMKRKQIIKVLNILDDEMCQCRTPREKDLKQIYDKTTR